jgi:cholinesterase
MQDTTLAALTSGGVAALAKGPDPNGPKLMHNFSEDCLSLNVWTKPQTGEKGKAVLLWLYGGGKLLYSLSRCSASKLMRYTAFAAGTSNTISYTGSKMANDEDVIIVSIKQVSFPKNSFAKY